MMKSRLRATWLAAALAAPSLLLSANPLYAQETNQEAPAMQRQSVNPTTWGAAYLMDQGEVVSGASRVLRTSGQVAIKEDPASELGITITHVGDLRGQIQDSLASIDAILEQADMTRSDIVHVHFYTTDIDGFLANYDVYASWIEPAGVMPPQSLLGVIPPSLQNPEAAV